MVLGSVWAFHQRLLDRLDPVSLDRLLPDDRVVWRRTMVAKDLVRTAKDVVSVISGLVLPTVSTNSRSMAKFKCSKLRFSM